MASDERGSVLVLSVDPLSDPRASRSSGPRIAAGVAHGTLPAERRAALDLCGLYARSRVQAPRNGECVGRTDRYRSNARPNLRRSPRLVRQGHPAPHPGAI